jgi:hypothetical protein
VLNNGLGRYENALAAAQELLQPPTPRLDQTIGWVLPELIEAAARSGHTELGRDALAQLADMNSGLAASDAGDLLFATNAHAGHPRLVGPTVARGAS